MNLGIVLALIAGLGTTLAYLDYNRAMMQGDTKPNGATWAIWSAISLVSTSSYFVSSGDFWKSIIPLINILFCIGTFVLALVKGKFEKLSKFDWYALLVGIIATLSWKLVSASWANAIVQIAVIIGFIPTWIGVWKDPSCEHSRPWWLWTTSYLIATFVVLLRWKGQWIDLLYPSLCVILHASVPIVGTVRRKKLQC